MMSFVYLCVDCGRRIIQGKTLFEGDDGHARCKACHIKWRDANAQYGGVRRWVI